MSPRRYIQWNSSYKSLELQVLNSIYNTRLYNTTTKITLQRTDKR